MPIFIVDGERYRIPFIPLSKGYQTTDKRWPIYKTKIRVKVGPKASINTVWSAQDDMTLQDLRNCNIPWKYISTAMNNKPIEDLKERWLSLREGGTKEIGATPIDNTNDVHFICELSDDGKVAQSVSFSDPLVTNNHTDADIIASRPSKVKHVFYTDETFDLEDVILLHKIAAKWERDKWLTVSTHFYEKTGRSITPDEAKSMINPEEV
ncbi:hypothetical protein BDV26DRAFT_285473 [Aspergillus bertholletiae]|uniref:Myb-like domain-containing protein n=1 Tax=Aspergillus bertholletiae TaxID=1226010 RepID=A0A5N7AVX0_9EURO|nr:hypothetical protein BDV26DRAFT_285473 [Aspergillus bertholletiae]